MVKICYGQQISIQNCQYVERKQEYHQRWHQWLFLKFFGKYNMFEDMILPWKYKEEKMNWLGAGLSFINNLFNLVKQWKRLVFSQGKQLIYADLIVLSGQYHSMELYYTIMLRQEYTKPILLKLVFTKARTLRHKLSALILWSSLKFIMVFWTSFQK